MRVILAEKPSVARDLARILGCTRREQGFFAGPTPGKGDLVTWAIGHLVRIAEPGEMDPRWGKPWRPEALPMLPTSWPLVAEPRTEDQFRVVSRLFNDRRVRTLVNATDAGREGESIFRRIYALSGSRKPVERFWTSSLTDEAIRSAFASLRPAADYDALGAAAEARAHLDWLIGMNHSRASTLHNHVLCSIGRVQTPTLAMIVRRHHEIAGFVKTHFFEVHAELADEGRDFIVRALTPEKTHAFEQRAEAEAILRDCPEGTPATVTAAERKPKSTPPPQLHNLGELQKESNRRFGLHADRTLAIAQLLYEKKCITYPRSSSRYLPDDMVAGLPAVLRALRLPGRETLVQQALLRTRQGPPLSRRFVDSSRLSDHHAIIPTAKPAPAGLPDDERKVYLLVAERFVAMFLPDKQTEETRIELAIAGHPFRAVGSRLLLPGWTAIFGGHAPGDQAPTTGATRQARKQAAGKQAAGEAPGKQAPATEAPGTEAPELEDRQSLPAVRKGETIPVLDSELVTRERKPPPRFTDATLLSAMETAGRELDDELLREALRGRGLGTEATRAGMIGKLLDLGYIERDGKALAPTGKGIALVAQVLPHLASAELTGDMEARLGEVEAGHLDAAELLAEAAASLRHEIPAVFRTAPLAAASAAPIVAGKGELRCPKCKAGLVTRRTLPDGRSFFGCARHADGCNFSVGGTVAGKALTDRNVQDLLSPGKRHHTAVIKGFRSKAGKRFDAALFLNPSNDFKTEFSFGK